jgi:hypothetical protein
MDESLAGLQSVAPTRSLKPRVQQLRVLAFAALTRAPA